MNKKAIKEGNGQAFPVPATDKYPCIEGLTKREYFAAMAMQGLCAGVTKYVINNPTTYANEAIIIADMLLDALHPQGTATDFYGGLEE